MKEYNSHYLGIVINNNDPEFRGRVQVFVPHIMPALYEGWNEKGEDIEISCIGDNIEGGMTSEILTRLVTILPWAEAASPIIGSSSPGGVASSIFSAVGGALQSVAGAIGSAANAVVGAVMDQSPSDAPVNVSGVDHGALFDNAANYGNIPQSRLGGIDSGGQCGQGTRMVIGALTNNPHFKKGLSAGGSEKASSLTVNGGNSYLQDSGMYKKPEPAPANYKDWSTDSSGKKIPNPQWQVGDVFVSNGGDAKGNGHVQVWTGKAWVSDFTQKGVGGVSPKYGNFSVVRMNDVGIRAVTGMAGKNGITLGESSSGSIAESASSSKFPAATSPQQTPEGTEQTPNNPTAITLAEGAGIQGTVSGGGTVTNTTGFSDNELKFAMRIAAGETGAGILNNAYNEATDPSKAVANTYFKEYQSSGLGVKAFASQKIASGSVDWKKVDIGYVQSNVYDSTQKGAINTGSYKDQIIGTAQAIRNLSAKNPALGNRVTESIKSGNFAEADSILGSRGGGSIGTKYYALADQPGKLSSLENRIQNEFGGDVNAALNAIDKELPPVPTIAEISNGSYDPNAVVGTQNQIVTAGLSIPVSPKIINNTDGYGPTVVKNTNDMPKGLFAYPNVGAMVWIFFREGNPLFPVYFAASYSANEWKAAYSGASLAPDGANNGSVDTQINNSVQFNPNAGGGMQFTHIRETNDPTGSSDKAYSMFFGDDGSNMMFAKGYHQIYTRHTRRDQIDGDAFRVVGGYEEKWVTGDSNSNIRGNCLIQIGKIDQESLDALQALADKSAEYNAKLGQTS